MGLPIVYFKGSQIDFSKLLCISVPEGSFNLWKKCIPMNSALCCISSGSSLFAKVLFYGFPVYKGLTESTYKHSHFVKTLQWVFIESF